MKKRRIRSSNKNNKNSVDDIKNKVLKEIRKELMARGKELEHTNEDDNIKSTPVSEPSIKESTANTPKKRGRKKKEDELIKDTDSLSVEDEIDYSQIKKPKNLKLTNARKANNNDEFYTRLSDVEDELRHYTEHFEGKTVLCNCDDPTWSAFWKYFHMNFSVLRIKRLIGTHYETEKPNSYAVVYEGGNDVDTHFYTKYEDLKGNGDFRSNECIEYLKECDIVVTNPPFSLAREFIGYMFTYTKKFVVVGDLNWVTYKDVFPHIISNKMWAGYCTIKEFGVRKDCLDGDFTDVRKFGNKMWFTNLPIKKRKEDLILYKNYNPVDYPKYDNYDAINVDKVKDIPKDYNGVMGVPITFIDKYNPDQFEIVGLTASNGKELSSGIWIQNSGVAQALVNGKKKYTRMFIVSKK